MVVTIMATRAPATGRYRTDQDASVDPEGTNLIVDVEKINAKRVLGGEFA